jgi:ATP-dependent DNA helicase UvrD/PcrA
MVAVRPGGLDDDRERAIVARLDPEQAAAASLADGPSLIIAPAGSGKTTTLIARLGVLLARGVDPERIAVATFNRDAALELSERIGTRLVPHHAAAGRIEVRTLHALARQVVLDGDAVRRELVADRLPVLRGLLRRHLEGADGAPPTPGLPDPPDAAALDTDISAWKVESRSPRFPALVEAYGVLMDSRGAIDFDDLVSRAVRLLETNDRLRLRWQGRFTHICVDEFQDVDAGQLRLIRLLAAPQDNLFVVGDDDQTIYAWRLADVRRILGFGSLYPSARRVQLATNYRCPPDVVVASRRLIGCNHERYAKEIRAGTPSGSDPSAAQVAAFDSSTDGWADQLAALAKRETAAERTTCFLARTRAELTPLLAAVVRAELEHATTVPAPIQSEAVCRLVGEARTQPQETPALDLLRHLRAAHGWLRRDGAEELGDEEHASLDALIGWSVGFRRTDAFLAAHDAALARLERLQRPDALVELVTVHAAKGREWQTVVVIGMEEDRFPNRRSLIEATEPERAVEEERRLAYVAMTRATRTLVLAFDPRHVSRFVVEAGLWSPPRG